MDRVGRTETDLMTNRNVSACMINEDGTTMITILLSSAPSGLVQSSRNGRDVVVNRYSLARQEMFVLDRCMLGRLHDLLSNLRSIVGSHCALGLLSK